MRKPSILVALLLITCVAAAPIPYVQEIQAGTWPGTATPPDGGTVNVTFEVKTDEGLAITFQVPEMGMSVAATEAKLEEGVLSFALELPGDVLSCALVHQEDGSYRGECVDQGGDAGYMVMNPPQR